MVFSTFHNHTTYCDGSNTAEEMVQAAVAAGCPAFGFSGHSYTWFDESYCMSKEGTIAYREEIRRLQEQYAGKIRILCGIEQDYWSEEPTDGYDYVIGSAHYVLKNGHYLPVDNSPEELMQGVTSQYNGDILAFCEDYYRQVADMVKKTHCTFVGHFDLVTKFNENEILFSQSDPRYVRAAESALDALCAQPVIFEINTGAMAKGYRTAPYPAEPLLKRIRDRGGRVILSSDCHNVKNLLFGLETARKTAESLGLSIVDTL